MAPVVVVGVNSWATVAQADLYFESRYNSDAWAALTLNQKSQLLITAFRWIRQQSAFSVPAEDTSEVVRQAQCEAAWFVLNWFEEYEKRRALTASGVKSYKAMDVSETFEAVAFPPFLGDILSDYNIEIGGTLVRVSRDLEDNSFGR